MGRLVKQQDMIPNIGSAQSVQLPGGTSAERPANPEPGQLRYNSTNTVLEYWSGSTWNQGSVAGLVSITQDAFVGDASTTVFVMTITAANATDLIVFIGGIYQNPGVSYTVDGTTNLTFTSAPPNLETVVVLHGYNRIT
jgi:hypothetical protein